MPFTLTKTSSLMASKIAFLAFAFHFNCSVVGVPVNPVLVANYTSGGNCIKVCGHANFPISKVLALEVRRRTTHLGHSSRRWSLMIQISNEALIPIERIDGPRGGELGLFQFLKYNKATLTYAILVRHQFTNRITKLPTQAKREITRSKA